MSDQPKHPRNVDDRVVEAFGDLMSRFEAGSLDDRELAQIFDVYESIFPWHDLPPDPIGFDAGCGSGRWARFFAPRVGRLICIDASVEALDVARRVLADHDNVEFRHEDLSAMGIADGSCDFGYSLGVLHHIPDTEDATRACIRKLKPGAPFLVYVYYDLEGVGVVRRSLLTVATGLRMLISRLPRQIRHLVTDLLALVLYLPLARLARSVEQSGRDPSRIPLFQYRNRSLYVIRNDALDRFGTRLEKRYSRAEVVELLEGSGLSDIAFSDGPPWWVAVGRRSANRVVGS